MTAAAWRDDGAAGRLAAGKRRDQLLRVAEQRFAEDGYHAVSMERLAEAAGVRKPVLYQHFASKRDLYHALVSDAAGQLTARVRESLAEAGENRDKVGAAIGAYFAFVSENRFRLLFDTVRVDDAGVTAILDDCLRTISADIASLIAHDAGLSEVQGLLLATGLRGLATESSRWWVARGDLSRAEAVDLLTRLAWHGLSGFGPQPGADGSGSVSG